MARTPYEDHNGQAGSVSGNETRVIQADGHEVIALPGAEFVQDAEILRDGQDLVLQGHDGQTVIIEGYFNADPAPALQAPDGQTLTPQLVESFVHHAGPAQFAQNGSLDDATPVGAVKEVTGHATVMHPDGTSAVITVGTPIYEGDTIETSGDGAVNVMFIDESTFAVSQNARLAVDEYVFDPRSQTGESNFSILRGIFVYTSGLIGHDDPDDVKLDTPMGSIGIRGTVIAGNVDTGEITVMEGAIVLTDFSGNEVTLAEQYQTARFMPSEGQIDMIGTVSPEDFFNTFDSVKPVAPGLFTAIDGGHDQPLAPDAPDLKPLAPEPADMQSDPQPQPDDGSQTMLSPTDTIGLAPNGGTTTLTTDTSFDGSATSGFGESAGTLDTSVDLTGTNTGDTAATATTATTATTQTTLQPPPGESTNTTTTGGTSTLTPPPPPSVINPTSPPADPHHIFLGGIIDSGRTGGGFFIGGGLNQHLGDYVAAAGDVNGDNRLDFFAAENVPAGGKVFAYDYSGNEQSGGGVSAAGAPSSSLTAGGIGDMDGDGLNDFIFGAPDASADTGSAQITLSGGGGVISFIGQSDSTGGMSIADNGDMFAASLAGIGDVNGDGFDDILVGAPGQDVGSQDDAGAAYLIYGGNSINTSIDITSLGTDGAAYNGTMANEHYGADVSAAGDLNNDGFADFMVSDPGHGEVNVYFGSDSGLGMKTITGIAVDAIDHSIPVIGFGDMDGDGIGEIGIGATSGTGQMYIFSGADIAAAGSTIAAGSAMATYSPAAGYEIVGGGAAGDFNGDGFADGVLAFRSGSSLEVFVAYGHGATGAVGMADLTNPANAFHMSLDLSAYGVADTSNFDIEITNPGDLNGDGFDDVVLGMSELHNGNGGVLVVDGRNPDAMGADGNMVHIVGQTTDMTGVVANGANQHLVGDAGANTLNASGFANISMHAGDGNDQLLLNNPGGSLGNLDGGGGVDTARIFGASLSLDFTAMGEDSVSGIERFSFQNADQTVTIGVNDILNLAQESQEIVNIGGADRKVVTFTNESGGTVNLNIDDHNASASPVDIGTPDSTVNVGGNTYNAYYVNGGYALLIDNDNVNANIV